MNEKRDKIIDAILSSYQSTRLRFGFKNGSKLATDSERLRSELEKCSESGSKASGKQWTPPNAEAGRPDENSIAYCLP